MLSRAGSRSDRVVPPFRVLEESVRRRIAGLLPQGILERSNGGVVLSAKGCLLRLVQLVDGAGTRQKAVGVEPGLLAVLDGTPVAGLAQPSNRPGIVGNESVRLGVIANRVGEAPGGQ